MHATFKWHFGLATISLPPITCGTRQYIGEGKDQLAYQQEFGINRSQHSKTTNDGVCCTGGRLLVLGQLPKIAGIFPETFLPNFIR